MFKYCKTMLQKEDLCAHCLELSGWSNTTIKEKKLKFKGICLKMGREPMLPTAAAVQAPPITTTKKQTRPIP